MLYHPGCGNGGGVLCFELLRRLARLAQVHLVAFSEGAAEEAAALPALREVVASVHVVPRPVLRVRGFASALRQALTGLPRELFNVRSERMRQTLSALARQHAPDALILQFPHMAQYVDAAPGVPVVVDVQDLCMVSRFREWRAGGGSLARRAMRAHSWWAWARYELRTYARAQRLMALSEADHGVLRAFLPRVASFLSPVAWELGAAVETRLTPLPPQVLFMGNFAHAPNADGLAWVLAEVWPKVRARCPSAELHVAGLNLPGHVASDAAQGVVVRGFLQSVVPALADASVALVPYRFGGGIKIKAVEALAHGCPVVATTVGSEGLQAADGVHLRVADGAEAYAEAVAELLADPEQQRRLAHQGQALVARRFSWDAKVQSLLAEIQGLRRETRARAARAPA